MKKKRCDVHPETRCADGNFAVPTNFSSLQTKRYAETHEIEVDYILETITAMEDNTTIKKNIVVSFYAHIVLRIIVLCVLKENLHVFLIDISTFYLFVIE